MTSAKKFLKEYERQTNTHDFDNVRSLIARNAEYRFTDGTHKGIKAIEKAFIDTWDTICDEVYTISDVRWHLDQSDAAVCSYDFHWRGKVNGIIREGRGQGLNVMVKRRGKWQMTFERLSSN